MVRQLITEPKDRTMAEI